MDILTNVVSRPAGRVVEGPVREIIDDALLEHQLASSQDLDRLRSEMEQYRSRLEDLEARLSQAEERADTLVDRLAEATQRADDAEDRMFESQTRAEQLEDELEALQERLRGADSSPAPASPKNGASPDSPARRRGCKVPDCDRTHRSKGFCSAHYQQWRRGTLEGYVTPQGVVADGPRRFRVDESLAGLPFTLSGRVEDRVIRVDKQTVEHTRLEDED